MIHYVVPFDENKKIGNAHNKQIECIPEDDWVCILDGDVMFLRPDWGKQIADVIKKHGDQFAVFGCLTNRLSGVHQLHEGEFSNNPNIHHHLDIANKCFDENYDDVKETSKNVAAMFMLFKKSTWTKVGGFSENSIRFDSEFTDKIKNQGGKMTIMQGLYVFHLYRFGKDNPRYFISHLI